MPAIQPHPQPDPAGWHPGPVADPRTDPCPGGATVATAPPHWQSRQLFGPHAEVTIAHGEAVYRLRITSLGKLILTK